MIGWIASGCRHWVYGCVVWAVRDAVAILQYERRGLLFLPYLERKAVTVPVRAVWLVWWKFGIHGEFVGGWKELG